MGLRLRSWWHRWKVFVRGECIHPDCEEPSMRYATRCSLHEGEEWDRIGRKIAQEKFDREAEVVAEGIRRAKERP